MVLQQGAQSDSQAETGAEPVMAEQAQSKSAAAVQSPESASGSFPLLLKEAEKSYLGGNKLEAVEKLKQAVLDIWNEVPLTVKNVRIVEDTETYATRVNNVFGKDVAVISSGTCLYPKKIFPELPIRSRYSYPGIQAGLAAKDTNVVAYVMVPPDAGQAKSIFKAYAEKYLEGILSRNSGVGYYNYKKKDLSVAGRIKLQDGVIVHVEDMKARIIR